jgi:hypothetical protein
MVSSKFEFIRSPLFRLYQLRTKADKQGGIERSGAQIGCNPKYGWI